MESKHSFKKWLVAATCGASVVAVAAGGVAMASTPSSTKPAASSTVAGSAGNVATVGRGRVRADLRWLATHTVHAQLIVDTAHGYKTVDIDRGKFSSDANNTITIVRPDGPTVSATITTSTRFRGVPESQLTSKDTVVVVQTSGNALVVWARPALSTSS